MTPVDQKYLSGNSEGIPGDCVRACVATILDLDADAVPHFVHLHGGFWNAELRAWLAERGKVLVFCEGMLIATEPVLWIGQSPRSAQISHMVVAVNGKIVHDPHPSRAGLDGDPSRSYMIR